ncbi:unannotated protein [freshwater metagenome]|uniref:Unannotated protein n=1 Tax=freshwater metagenome TaxID=449393 RepID=A0A6J7KJK7_9ZZZZ
MVGAVAALTILAAGPASALAPGNVAAGTPLWSPSILKASGSFTNSVTTSSATYSYTLQLVRTTTTTKPSCGTSGCVTGGSQVRLNTVTSSVSVAAGGIGTIPVLSVKCTTSSTARLYWSWLKVADSSGNVVYSTSSALSGKLC